MAVTAVEIRSGTYYDSVVLMQLQRSLSSLPDVQDAGVVMGTAANKEILAQIDMLTEEARTAQPDDLVIVVRASDTAAARSALSQVDALLTRRRTTLEQEYRPKSLETAVGMLPNSHWVLISVPGRYAADLTREVLELGRSVFLYSDNVSVEEEVSLKRAAARDGLLVMGPDCGTAIIGGTGLGFANQVRRGPIGIVAASGTGLQLVTARIHQLGSGVTHALGTGGRDLTEAVGAMTARHALDLLARDPETQVIVLVSKPPSPKVASQLLRTARSAGKPVVVDFIGYAPPLRTVDNLSFASTLDEAADLAVQLAADQMAADQHPKQDLSRFAPSQRYLRGLFSGGTLAYEALLILQAYLPTVYSNVPLDKRQSLAQSAISQEHTIVDLGEDEFTVGRLHPMMDNDLRLRRLRQEANDPEVAVILLDVVLGHGSHPDPASELAPAIADAQAMAERAGRFLEVVTVVVGTDADPQGLDDQVRGLAGAGAHVETSNQIAVQYCGRLLRALNDASPVEQAPPVDLSILQQPFAAINIGLESFAESLLAQGAGVVHVDWSPPAGGNERLMAILARMKG